MWWHGSLLERKSYASGWHSRMWPLCHSTLLEEWALESHLLTRCESLHFPVQKRMLLPSRLRAAEIYGWKSKTFRRQFDHMSTIRATVIDLKYVLWPSQPWLSDHGLPYQTGIPFCGADLKFSSKAVGYPDNQHTTIAPGKMATL